MPDDEKRKPFRFAPSLFLVLAVFLGLTLQVRPQTPKKIDSVGAFDEFTNFYYEHPRPELMSSAIQWMQSSGIPAQNSQVAPMVGFFAEVFAANRSMNPEWQAEIEKTSGLTKSTLTIAMKVSRKLGALIEHNSDLLTVADNDICWGAYFASGKKVYLEALVQRLAYMKERKSIRLYSTAFTAQWSLCSNALNHQEVKAFLEAAQKKASPDIRTAIKEALTETPSEIKEAAIKVVKRQHAKKIW